MPGVVPSNFTPPPLPPGFVPRPALVQRLTEGLDRRLTLVAAPAGYGKSTTTAAWLCTLQGTQWHTAWYGLDPDDDDFSTFFTRFVAAIATAFSGALPAELAVLPAGLALQGISPATYAQSLTGALLALPDPLVLVLDDHHVITTPAIHSVVAHLIQYAAGRLHLVIATRHDPPLPIARMRVQQQVTELRVDDLRLANDEAAAFLARRLSHPPTAEEIAVLQARTEGWAAGLQLAAVSLGRADPGAFLQSFAASENLYVLDFLLDEVLEHTPAQVKEFLLKTALVARFNADLCALLTGFDGAVCRQTLDRLRQQHMFLVPLDGERTWFRYHHQFRTMLLNRAALSYPDELMRSLRRAAAGWLAAHGWTDAAIAEYAAAASAGAADENLSGADTSDWEAAADLAEGERHVLQNRQEWHLLWQRLQRLPSAVVARRPGLLLAQAWLLQIHFRYASLITVVEAAAGLLSSPTDPPPTAGVPVDVLWGEIKLLRGAHFRPDVPLPERMQLVQDALAALRPAETYEWARGFAFLALAHVLIAQGRYDDAYRAVMAEIESASFGSGAYVSRLHHVLGIVRFYDGSLDEVQRAAARYLELSRQHNLPVGIGWASFGLAWSLFQGCADPQAVWAALLPIYERLHAVHLHTALVALPLLVVTAVELGPAEVDTAGAIVERMHGVALDRENIAAADEVAGAAALAALLRGDAPAAAAWAEEFFRTRVAALAEAADASMGLNRILLCARILLACGSPAAVAGVIAPLSLMTESIQRRGFRSDALQGAVLLACCCARADQPVKAQQWLQMALEFGVPRGYRRLFFDAAPDILDLLQLMTQRKLGGSAPGRLLAEYAAWSARPAPSPERSPFVHPPTRGGSVPLAHGGAARTQSQSAPSLFAIDPLTDREAEVLALLAERLANKEIARRLNISVLTVRNHTSRIYAKLGVASRKQAVAQARLLHLLP